MLEIFAIVACCKKIGEMVRKRGRTAVGYQVLFVLLWFGGEFSGLILMAASGGAEGMAIYVGGLLGAAAGAGIGFLIVSMLSDLSRQIDYSSQRFGYAPNLPPSNAPYDPANPYAAPQRSNPTDLPPVVLDPNDVMGWLDQQQRKS